MAEQLTNEERSRRNLERLEAGHAAAKATQTRELLIDVDEAWAERQRAQAPFVFRVGGEDYTVPSERPLNAHLYIAQHCLHEMEGGGLSFVVPDERLPEFLALVLGEGCRSAIERAGISLDLLNDTVLRPVLAAWGYFLAPRNEEKKTAPILA